MVERHLYRYEYVDAPFDDVARLLAEEPATLLLQSATDAAVEQAERVRRELVVELAGFEIGREVTIDVGEFDPVEVRRVKIPLRWRASQAGALFPQLEAVLEVAALSFHPPRTQITLIASYEPPLGLLGAAGDALWGHRVAEAAIHRFLQDIVRRMEEELAQQDHPTFAS